MSDNNNIHFRAEVIIKEGKKEEYKKLIQDMSRAVEANEPDTINYRFYLNKSETECIVWETYTNSETDWSFLANYLVKHSFLADIFRRIGDRILPFMLIVLGIYILTEAYLLV
jgi:cadmium resistance protein CadD (predicted permease)